MMAVLTLTFCTCLQWTIGYSSEKDKAPEKFYDATVPGNCQLDIAKAENFPDYKYADNYKLFGRLEDVYFTYRTEFDAPSCNDDEGVWFYSKGIDYEFDIILNKKNILHQEGMFTPVDIEITQYLKKKHNVLEVLVYKAPKRHNNSEDRTQASNVAKPPVSYGWDWHPRLIVSGIYDETGLVVRKKCHIESFELNYKLSDDFKNAAIKIKAPVTEATGKETLEWKLYDRESNVVASKTWKAGDDVSCLFANPELWWCHDHGTPYLYDYEVVLKDANGNVLDSKNGRVGFRRIRLVMNEGAWSEPKGFPTTRSNPPAQFELNGRRIFAKGSNWLAPDIFIGRITKETYEPLLDYAVAANMNALRCWGGCAAGKDSFFELCDEKGILIWQEFPLSCNSYPDEEHYLEVLEKEAESIVKRIHPHPCLALWCGGNELFNNWSKTDDQSLALRILNAVCLRLSPEIPFNPTSPLGGMAHGCYLFDYKDSNVFEWMRDAHYTAYTEFGMPGASCREVLESIIPEDELFPAKPGGAWEAHHAFKAWDGTDTWLAEPTLTKYFGQAQNLDELIANSQTLQCIGYKHIFEIARMKKPYCAMAMNWCYNEPWPAAANNSLLTYPAIEKPALKAVGEACRPVCAAAGIDKFQWQEGQEFFCRLYILNDSYDSKSCNREYKIKAYLKTDEGTAVDLVSEDGANVWSVSSLKPGYNAEGQIFKCTIPESSSRFFKVFVEVDGYPGMNSEYILSLTK